LEWNDLTLDYQSLQLALAWMEIEADAVKNNPPYLLNFIIDHIVDFRDAPDV